ncbi:MAG: phosphotransferase family protein [Candidatus Eiseniibacteriota bacterium]
MARNALAITTTDLDRHPAARAWESLGGAVPASVALLREASRSKPAVHRLTFSAPGAPAVFAKRFHPAGLDLERRIYETILPRLPVTVAPYRGACVDDEGSAWMFLEDVGEACLSPRDPEHRALAGRWLGLLHRSAEKVVAAEILPDAGPGRYLAHLRQARAEIRQHAGNRGLTLEDRGVLNAVLAQGEALEARWSGIERACDGFPVTLVHADFQPKNVRIRTTETGPLICPIDWETAGRGVPAADLALASSRGLVMQIDPATYGATVREVWPHLDVASIRRLSILGHVFQSLAGIQWACADLRFETQLCLIRPLSQMRLYVAQIRAALEAGEEWLG